MNAGKVIRSLRLSINMQRKVLAKLSGISDNALGNIEFGRSRAKESTLNRICDNLRISPAHLHILSMEKSDIDDAMFKFCLEPMQKEIARQYLESYSIVLDIKENGQTM